MVCRVIDTLAAPFALRETFLATPRRGCILVALWRDVLGLMYRSPRTHAVIVRRRVAVVAALCQTCVRTIVVYRVPHYFPSVGGVSLVAAASGLLAIYSYEFPLSTFIVSYVSTHKVHLCDFLRYL